MHINCQCLSPCPLQQLFFLFSLLQNPTAPTSNFSPRGKILSCFRKQQKRVSHTIPLYPSSFMSIFTPQSTFLYCLPGSSALLLLSSSLSSQSLLFSCCFPCAYLHLFPSLFQVSYCLHSEFLICIPPTLLECL